MPKFGLEGKMRHWIAEYDAARDSKAVGDVTLRGDVLPVGAVVLGAYIDVETAVTSGGLATVALKVTAPDDILAAAAIAGFALGALLIGVPDFATVADAVRVATSPKSVVASIAVDTLLTGKFHVHLFGFVRQ